jgi:beta-alanine--pyruvate transaminase
MDIPILVILSSLCCSLATLDIYQNENLFAKAATIAPYWQDALQSLKDISCIIDIRTIGLIAGD